MDIKDFLAQDEIRELIAENDLEAVYDRYYPLDRRKDLSEYLIDLGINPVNYFKKSIPEAAFAHCTNSTSIVIPDNITSIGQFAFYNCSGLTSVTIGGSVTSIGNYAFHGCRFTSITIPDSVTSIGNYAFYNCRSLTSVTIPDSVTTIGSDTFRDCTSLTSVTFGENSQLTSIGARTFYGCRFTSITIPDSVTSIGVSAFTRCGLTSITIPDSVTSIGDYAFYECYNLTEITYSGTGEQWRKIKKHREWCYESTIKVIHCIDGDIELK